MILIDIDALDVPAFRVLVDADGALRYGTINTAHMKLTGLRVADLVGRTPHECLPAAIADHVAARYRSCVVTEQMQEYEEQLDLPAGHFWWRTTLVPVRDAAGKVASILGLAVDITERKLAEIELRSAAFKDPLTGICNRRRFERDLEYAVARANDTNRSFSMILADVNRFKPINDRHGHAIGDEVLKAIAGRMAQGIRETDRLARIGGDEFAAIISAGSDGAVAVALDRMRRKLAGTIQAGGLSLIVGVSLGAALWRTGMATMDVTAAADAAMYREKAARAA